MKENVFQLFAKQASPLQRRVIEVWLSRPGNEEQYYEWLEEWERQHTLYEDNSEKAFGAFRDFMERHEPTESLTVNPPGSCNPRNAEERLESIARLLNASVERRGSALIFSNLET